MDKLEGDIYESLKKIEAHEKQRIDSKAFISDFLSGELIKLGYKKVPELTEMYPEGIKNVLRRWSVPEDVIENCGIRVYREIAKAQLNHNLKEIEDANKGE